MIVLWILGAAAVLTVSFIAGMSWVICHDKDGQRRGGFREARGVVEDCTDWQLREDILLLLDAYEAAEFPG